MSTCRSGHPTCILYASIHHFSIISSFLYFFSMTCMLLRRSYDAPFLPLLSGSLSDYQACGLNQSPVYRYSSKIKRKETKTDKKSKRYMFQSHMMYYSSSNCRRRGFSRPPDPEQGKGGQLLVIWIINSKAKKEINFFQSLGECTAHCCESVPAGGRHWVKEWWWGGRDRIDRLRAPHAAHEVSCAGDSAVELGPGEIEARVLRGRDNLFPLI